LSQQVTEKILSLRALQLRLVEAHECVGRLNSFCARPQSHRTRRYLKDVIAHKLPINHEITQLLQVCNVLPCRDVASPAAAGRLQPVAQP
jgi:hypothetical protein